MTVHWMSLTTDWKIWGKINGAVEIETVQNAVLYICVSFVVSHTGFKLKKKKKETIQNEIWEGKRLKQEKDRLNGQYQEVSICTVWVLEDWKADKNEEIKAPNT